MAFNVFFNVVTNDIDNYTKSNPWRCDVCHKDHEVMTKISVDYDTLILCKKCLMGAKRIITDKEKELKDVRKSDL